MDAEEKIRRGEHAKRLQDDPVLREAMDLMLDQCIRKWMATKPEEHERREELYRELTSLKGLRTNLQGFVNDGVLAKHNANQPPVT